MAGDHQTNDPDLTKDLPEEENEDLQQTLSEADDTGDEEEDTKEST